MYSVDNSSRSCSKHSIYFNAHTITTYISSRSGTRRRSVSSALQLLSGRLSKTTSEHQMIKYADDISIYTSGPVVADLVNGLNIYLSQVLNYKAAKNRQCQRPNLHQHFFPKYSRAPPTSTCEVGRRSTTARKEAKGAKNDARHPSLFHTTLQQYRSNSAATQ